MSTEATNAIDVPTPVAAEVADAHDIAAVLDLIAAEQKRPDRNVPTVGSDRSTLPAEFDEFEPPWTTTVRVIRSTSDTASQPIRGAILCDWNVAAGRAWIHGPWIRSENDDWIEQAVPLIDATLDQLPDEITGTVLCGSTAHRLIERLADELGWRAAEVNHALAVTADTIASWPILDRPAISIREVIDHDLDALRPLHDTEFPSTYHSAPQLIERARRAEHLVLVATDDEGEVYAYAAGRVQPDGDGYIDFVAAEPRLRRRGTGRALVTALARRLVPDSSTRRVCLVVRDSNGPARALYESLGFEIDVSIVAYESDGTRRAVAGSRID